METQILLIKFKIVVSPFIENRDEQVEHQKDYARKDAAVKLYETIPLNTPCKITITEEMVDKNQYEMFEYVTDFIIRIQIDSPQFLAVFTNNL